MGIMSPETYQLLDLAIKIGLGATVGGAFSYFVARASHKHSIERLKLEHASARKTEYVARARQLIEGVATSVEAYLNSIIELSDVARTIHSQRASVDAPIAAHLRTQLEDAVEAQHRLVGQYTGAGGILRMLGYKRAVDKFYDMGRAVGAVTTICSKAIRSEFDEDQLRAALTNMTLAKGDFLEALGEVHRDQLSE